MYKKLKKSSSNHSISDNLLDEELPRSKTYSGYNGYGLPPLPPTNQGMGQGSSNQVNGMGSRPPSGSSVKMRSPSVLSTPRRENVYEDYLLLLARKSMKYFNIIYGKVHIRNDRLSKSAGICIHALTFY